MKGNTSKEAFNNAGGFTLPKTIRDYTHRELRNGLNTMSKLAKPGSHDEKFMVALDKHYMQIKEQKELSHFVQHQEFTRGVHRGIHREHDRHILDQNQQAGMQFTRKAIMKEAKMHYQANYSLTSKFNHRSTDKGLGVGKG